MRWDWKIRSYEMVGGREVFCIETVHRGEHSKNMELAAIAHLGRRAVVTDLRAERQRART